MLKILRLYASVAATAFLRSLRAWPVALAVLLYFAIMALGSTLLGRLGLAGGFILGFVEAACISSYLALLAVAVNGSKVTWGDLQSSFTALLWDVIGVLFALWILSFVVEALTRAAPDRALFIQAAYGLLIGIFLNPVPELIYQRRAPGRTTELLFASARFVQEHWIEWFLPNLAIGAAILGLAFGAAGLSPRELMVSLPSLVSLQGAFLLGPTLLASGSSLWVAPLVLAFCHFAMLFRGLLFKELSTGGWRGRALRSSWR